MYIAYVGNEFIASAEPLAGGVNAVTDMDDWIILNQKSAEVQVYLLTLYRRYATTMERVKLLDDPKNAQQDPRWGKFYRGRPVKTIRTNDYV